MRPAVAENMVVQGGDAAADAGVARAHEQDRRAWHPEGAEPRRQCLAHGSFVVKVKRRHAFDPGPDEREVDRRAGQGGDQLDDVHTGAPGGNGPAKDKGTVRHQAHGPEEVRAADDRRVCRHGANDEGERNEPSKNGARRASAEAEDTAGGASAPGW